MSAGLSKNKDPVKKPKPEGNNETTQQELRLSTLNGRSYSQGVLRELTSRAARVETQTKIFASMCPDEILDHYDTYSTRSYNTTLMLGDVSGFTEMTEKFGKSGGPSKLTETLNSYIGAMVQEILSHKGDVLKFSGDAFIVMWKLEEGRLMRDIASEAIKTACVIQKHYGTYETDVGVTMRVKLAIASGTTYVTSIGDASLSSYYIVTGPPVWEVKFAEGLCSGGDILVAPSCWQWVNPHEYIYEMLPDDFHTKIISLSLLWDAPDDSFSDDEGSSVSNTETSSISKIGSSASSSTSINSTTKKRMPSADSARRFSRQGEGRVSDSSIDYSLRPKVIRTSKMRLAKQIKSYVLRPVVRSVEMDEPLEYLTEIRQVVIVFVNIIATEMNRSTLIKLVNSTYIFVCKVVDEMQGCVNKTSLFDKDLMLLCIFGLRGDKHELESQIGLRCAAKLRRGLVRFEKVESVSIGVTTGMTYCGVVGHVLRREYTVIGMTVNKAARLMVAYRDKVVCDRETFLQSRLEAKHFFLLQKYKLKGISNVGPVYEFIEQSDTDNHFDNVHRHPILGRNRELKEFYKMMMRLINEIGPKKERVSEGLESIQADRISLLDSRNSSIISNYIADPRQSAHSNLSISESRISSDPERRDQLTPTAPAKPTRQVNSRDEPLFEPRKPSVQDYYHILDVRKKSSTQSKDALRRFNKENKIRERDEEVKHIMLVRGDARIGKTRLLEEITYIIPNDTKQIFISMRPSDHLHPFLLIRKLFYVPLDISNETPINVKEEALRSRYSKADRPLLCCLNQAFQVKFPTNNEFLEMNNKEKKSLRKKYVLQLLRSCFDSLWILMVDDLELADDESIPLFTTIIEKQKNLLSVLAYGNKLTRTYSIPYAVEINCLVCDLTGIKKQYHAALACQTLEVIAIPPELERVLQEKSSGNPGWIDSYLISLLQSNGVEKKFITRMEIHTMGLITPSKNWIKRNPKTTLEVSEMHVNEIELGVDWEMFQYCYKEHIPEDGEIDPQDTNTYPVCYLTEFFNQEAVHESTTVDSILLKLYDSLTPLDQKLIKCSAVLGEVIDRKMLEKLMIGTIDRDIAICIAKLFELRILCCAVDNLRRRSSIKLPSFLELNCGCRKSILYEATEDLPNYASCRLMRFKIDSFRHMAYGLLTENQKVEFHNKALRYLQQNTRRCSYCGAGQFRVLLGEVQQSDIERKRERHTMDKRQTNSNPSIVEDFKDRFKRRSSVTWDKDEIEAAAFYSCVPLKKSRTISFSQVDFMECSCNLILMTAYSHILEHCRGIAAKNLMLIVMMEYAEVCLNTQNITQATKLLEEAMELVDEIHHPSVSILIVVPYLKGRIQTLRARCFLNSGLLTEAETCFDATLKILRYNFPENLLKVRIKTYRYLRGLRLMMSVMANCWVGMFKGDAADYNNQFANCLSFMFDLFKIQGQWEHCRLAAIWGLYVALKSNNDFFVLAKSYSNMFVVAHWYHYLYLLPYLEVGSLFLCNTRTESIELQDIKTIAELYIQIFDSRWIRGYTKSAASVGYVALRLASTCKSLELKLWLLPRMVTISTVTHKFSDIVIMLKELELDSHTDLERQGKTWFYALSVDFFLETGVSLISYDELDAFFQHESVKIWNLKDSEACNRFFSSVWLWFVRLGEWELATVWKHRNHQTRIVFEDFTVPYALTQLRILEALMLCYVYKKDSKNIKEANIIKNTIKNRFKEANKTRKIVKSIQPRYFLMRAYNFMLNNRLRAALRSVRKAKTEATKYGNSLLYNWCSHNEKNWLGTLDPALKNYWVENTKYYEKPNWNEIDIDFYHVIPFTLPLPKRK